MKEKINSGFIGLGQRGRMLFEEEAIKTDDINIVALCDAYEDRAHELSNVVKEKKTKLYFNVYQKNTRAIHFYQREGFEIQREGLDEVTGEKDYVMVWQRGKSL